jgi:hypothetical protein
MRFYNYTDHTSPRPNYRYSHLSRRRRGLLADKWRRRIPAFLLRTQPPPAGALEVWVRRHRRRNRSLGLGSHKSAELRQTTVPPNSETQKLLRLWGKSKVINILSFNISHLFNMQTRHCAKSPFILGFISALESIAGSLLLPFLDRCRREHNRSLSLPIKFPLCWRWKVKCVFEIAGGSTTPFIATLKNEQSAFA